MYNLTNFSGNETGLLTFTQNVNTVIMGGMLGTILLIGIALIIYIAIIFFTGDAVKAGLTTGFIGFILSLSLLSVGLIPPIIPYIFVILWVIPLALSWGR